jgi:multiple sugar transport system permease protein
MHRTPTKSEGPAARGRPGESPSGERARPWGRLKGEAPAPSRRGEMLAAVLFLAPALAALLLFRIVPAVSAVFDSFRSSAILVNVSSSFAGLQNYQSLFSSPEFLNSLRVTLLFVAIIVPLQTVAALGFALLLTQNLPGTKVWRFVLFLPFSVPLGISTIVWGTGFRPDGPINAVLEALGLGQQPFLSSTAQALPSIMVLVSWVGVGYWMVFLIAGLQDVPNDCLEAAAIDGAGWWRRLFYVVLPLMRRPLAFIIVANTVGNFILFVPVQALTRGGPEQSTNLLMYDIYQNIYVAGNQAIAAAEVTLLIIAMLTITIFQFRLLSAEGKE